MAKDTSQFSIKDRELAEALEISLDRLYEIIEFFDHDPNDEWDLRVDEHFIWLNKSRGTRLFSQLGAFAIAKYMDSIEAKTLWNRFIEFITKHKERLRNAFVRQRVHENCTSLTRRNNHYFLSRKDVVNILCTSYARLDQSFRDIKTSDKPLEESKDYIDIDGVRYYSLTGIIYLSSDLGAKLKRIDRQEWCKAVSIVANKTLLQIISAEERRAKRIAAVKQAAKRRDKCCQITGLKPKPANKVELAAHHVFCQKYFPHLAESLDNLITVSADIHQEFHQWNGGFDKPCTVDDLIRFVNEHYADEERYPEQNLGELYRRLNQIKQIFADQKVA